MELRFCCVFNQKTSDVDEVACTLPRTLNPGFENLERLILQTESFTGFHIIERIPEATVGYH